MVAEREAVVSRMRPRRQKQPRDVPGTNLQGGPGMDSRAHITCPLNTDRCKPTGECHMVPGAVGTRSRPRRRRVGHRHRGISSRGRNNAGSRRGGHHLRQHLRVPALHGVTNALICADGDRLLTSKRKHSISTADGCRTGSTSPPQAAMTGGNPFWEARSQAGTAMAGQGV